MRASWRMLVLVQVHTQVIFIQIKINILTRSKDVQIAMNSREILKVHYLN